MTAETKRPDALLVYDGSTLDDLFGLLESLDVKPQRARLTGPTRFDGWSQPPRLFVIPAKDALNTPWPQGALGHNVCRIAVTESTSEVLGALVSELGYDYLIRRPVHPEVLRMLLARALYCGAEARLDPRRPAARQVSLRVGWRNIPATLIDISRGGARLLARAEIEVLDAVAITLSLGASDERKITLPGRVIRKRTNTHDGVVSLALRFLAEIEPESLAEIGRLLEGGALGPAPELPRAWNDQLRSWWKQGEPERPGKLAKIAPVGGIPEVRVDAVPARPLAPAEHSGSGSAGEAEALEAGAVAEPSERRRLRRGTFDSEVVLLDPDTAAMRSVLVGRELSVVGMHIDPHPGAFVGDGMTLALHDIADGSHGPLLVSARVARDDGSRGLALEFEALTTEASARLARLVDALPAASGDEPNVSNDGANSAAPGVESLGDAGPEGIVFARVLEEPALPEDVRR